MIVTLTLTCEHCGLTNEVEVDTEQGVPYCPSCGSDFDAKLVVDMIGELAKEDDDVDADLATEGGADDRDEEGAV